MYTTLVVLAIIISLLLILAVLIQNPKGGGIGPAFGDSSQMLGVQKTGDIVEKSTWILSGSLIILSLVINFFIPGGRNSTKSIIQDQIDKTEIPMPKDAEKMLKSSDNSSQSKPADKDTSK